jgi:hypothetical protein
MEILRSLGLGGYFSQRVVLREQPSTGDMDRLDAPPHAPIPMQQLALAPLPQPFAEAPHPCLHDPNDAQHESWAVITIGNPTIAKPTAGPCAPATAPPARPTPSAAAAAAAARRGEGRCLIGEFGPALSDLDAAVAAQPNDAWALARRGAAKMGLGLYESALEDLIAADALEPGDPGLLAARWAALTWQTMVLLSPAPLAAPRRWGACRAARVVLGRHACSGMDPCQSASSCVRCHFLSNLIFANQFHM